MKRFHINLLAGALFALALGSCKKENLEKFPHNAVPLEGTFITVQDAANWNTGLYNILRARFGGAFATTQEIQADHLNATIDFGNRNGFPHRWEGFEATEGNLVTAWANYYRAITNLNLSIPGFENITPSDAATNAGRLERGNLLRYKADNHFARAYYYHELVLRYGKPYEPATAATDLGVPLIMDYDPKGKPARASVQAIYNQILQDINQARTYFTQAKTEYDQVTTAGSRPNITGAQGSNKFTVDALMAFEARVRLHMQDWAGAKIAADAVIATGRYPLISTEQAFKEYWHDDAKTEDIMQLAVINTQEGAPTNGGVYLGYRTSDGRYRPDFMPTKTIVDAYPATDIRKPVYFARLPLSFTVGTITLTLVNKYPGNPKLFTTNNTNYQHAPKFLRIAEMYVISAEAGARGSEDADALAKLNSLKKARGITELTGLMDQALFDEVKAERSRELAFEGFRLWDLKRWHEGFTGRTPQDIRVLSTGAGYTNLTIPADHPKFVWGIPSNDIQVNPNMVQNPGW